ncbi:unnamed protein product [Blepharisma stoltei]|uniref:Uncharacterized protein n=1 Tax=Blepharisma stoltei TaxID=1481888 RepID=A0AAU9IRR1_9CILI|nr:unnamed protein product [Blepharisma stoltei]
MDQSLISHRDQTKSSHSKSMKTIHLRTLSSQSPHSQKLKIFEKLPTLHKRTSSNLNLPQLQNTENLEKFTRDISYRLDTLEKVKSRLESQEHQLKDILGVNPEVKPFTLPTSLIEIEKEINENSEMMNGPQNKFIKELESLKLKIFQDQLKRNENIIKEGGLLFRTQNGLIQPHLSNLHEKILNKRFHKEKKEHKALTQRGELELGAPSGRREAELLSEWLDYMIEKNVINTEKCFDEKIRAAQLIYTLCFKEVVRQISVHCIERGILMEKIWNAQVDLYSQHESTTIESLNKIERKFADLIKDQLNACDNKVKELNKIIEALKQEKEDKEIELDIKERDVIQLRREINKHIEDKENLKDNLKEAENAIYNHPRIKYNSKIKKNDIAVDTSDFIVQEAANLPVSEIKSEIIDLITSDPSLNLMMEKTNLKLNPLKLVVSKPENILIKSNKAEQLDANTSLDFYFTYQYHDYPTQTSPQNLYIKACDSISIEPFKRMAALIEASQIEAHQLKEDLELLNKNMTEIEEKAQQITQINEPKANQKTFKGRKMAKSLTVVALSLGSIIGENKKILENHCNFLENNIIKNIEQENFCSQTDFPDVIPEEAMESEEAREKSLPERLHKSIQRFQECLSAYKNNRKSPNEIMKDDLIKRKGNKLRILLDRLYPIIEESDGNQPKMIFDNFSQTDLTGDNVFIDRVLRQPTGVSESDKNFESFMSDQNTLRENNMLNPYLNDKESSDQIMKTFDNRTNIKRLLRIPSEIPSSRTFAVNSEETKEHERIIDRHRIRTSLPKIAIAAEEFLLGQIQKKIFLTHPGQKLLRQIMKDLQSKKQVKHSIGIKNLMKIINNLYTEKSLLCRENQSHRNDEASNVLYDMMINRYGLKNVAENKFKDVIISSMVYSETNLRVRNFTHFLGIQGNYSLSDWNFYLNSIEFMGYCNLGPYILNDESSNEHYSPYERAAFCAMTYFQKKLPLELYEKLIWKLEKLKIEPQRSMKSHQKITIPKINTDEFLDLMLEYYHKLKDVFYKYYFSEELKNSEFLELEPFIETMSKIQGLKINEEGLRSGFESYCNYIKNEVGEIVKGISVESLLSFGVDNDAVNFQILFEKTQ